MKWSGLSLLGLFAAAVHGAATSTCKCYPGDSCWPAQAKWNELNTSVGGRLSVELPPGLPCFATYNGQTVAGANDPVKCAEVTAKWNDPDWVASLGTWPMLPFWSNTTCYPSNAGSCTSDCKQGVVATYVIKATKVADIQAGIKFAKKYNLRLIIRNTGHDFMGRSTGYGALVINTWRLKDVTLHSTWTGPGGYTGKAVTAGAGVMIHELYDKVWAANQDVLAGECPTVGVAGGYVQGGGQGPLSGIYGLASDNAVQFTAVLADGTHVTANSRTYPDLFWALKGGGPGTFAVVTSVTFKTFNRVPVSGMSLNIVGSGDTFWEGYRIWHTFSPQLVKHGIYVWYAASEGSIIAQPFVAPNKTKAELEAILQPMLTSLTAANVTYTASAVKTFPNFGQLYNEMWFTAYHAANGQAGFGGRLISLTDSVANGDNIVAAFREVLAKYPGVGFGGHLVNPGNRVPDPNRELSAVHPVFRNTADVLVYLYFLEDCLSAQRRAEVLDAVTNDIGAIIRRATPNSAVYSNEGDINEPNWQDAFWGNKVYPKLLKLKEKYDPDRTFWVKSTPGSEKWKLVNERLCKA